MKPVFLDTVGLIAIWDESDQWHELATSAFQTFVSQRRDLVTTTTILFECGNASARRPYRNVVDELRRELRNRHQLIDPTFDDIENAWADYTAGLAGDSGIVDHISFNVMRRLGLTDVFTNDRHFKIAGFVTLF